VKRNDETENQDLSESLETNFHITRVLLIFSFS
jgi:hypothetical protein